MEHVNLGRTGLRVSRVCLGMMSYGASEGRPWALDEAAALEDRSCAHLADPLRVSWSTATATITRMPVISTW